MAILDPNNPTDSYQRAAEDRFWKIVKDTLKHIFGKDPGVADEYRKLLIEAPVEERTLVFHAEPLDIAADLADQDITQEHVIHYATIVRDVRAL